MGLWRGSTSAQRGGMPMSGNKHSRKRRLRIGLAVAAAGALTLAAVADGFAQRGGFGAGGFRGGNIGAGGRSSGGDSPCNPGAPRFPGGGGGIVVPGGYGGP